MMLQLQCNPRIGHLEALCHFFAYLKNHPKMGRIVYEDKVLTIDKRSFESNADWKDFYGNVTKELLPKMLETRGNR